MAWTQSYRHLQLTCEQPDIASSLISQAELCESLLGADLPATVWEVESLLPAANSYPSPYHHDNRTLSAQDISQALFCGFRYRITLMSEQADLAIEDWIGQSVALHWGSGDLMMPAQTRHGIITEVTALGSNQGMAAYQIICEPALAQLRLASHNRRHHHLSLAELIGKIIHPDDIDLNINIEIDDSLKDCHIQHSVQYNQTDLSYLQYHLALFGITGYYRHEVDGHTLVLVPHDAEVLRADAADIHSILSQNPANLADRQDRVTSIKPKLNHHITQSQLSRYDHRLMGHYLGSHSSDQPLKYPSEHARFLRSQTRMDDETLTELASRYQYLQEQQAHTGMLQGNIRHLNLPSSHLIEGNPFITQPISLAAIHHRINNHLPIDWLGKAQFDPITLQPKAMAKAQANPQDQEVHEITALYLPFPHHHHIPFAAQLAQLGQPHPSLTGLMSASIIDTDSQAVTTDRNHRAHIHYHWQNDASGASDDTAHWVPIASHLVADHMGQTHPLRHGQHVLIDFIGGDIAHPVIVGSTHNGVGNPDAQHNSIASDSDTIDATSPVWFINQSHAHPIDGIKTQSIDSSRTGDANKDSLVNGYNQIVFDQHPDSPQINIYSSSHQSSLTLGQLYQHTDHERGQARGRGISLETQAAGTLQGAKGIHISSRSQSESHMSHQSHSKLQTADQHLQAYQMLAETHQPVGLVETISNSNNKDSGQSGEQQTPFAKVSQNTNDSVLSEFGQWQQPHVLIDSQRHLAIMTGQHSQHTSSKNTHAHATDDTYHHSQTQMNKLVSGDIHYYSNKSQTHTAAHGDLTLQAHQSEIRLDSEQTLRIHSRDSIEIIAPNTLTLKAAGSGIEMTGGNVTIITPSQAGYKASKLDWGSGGDIMAKAVSLRQANIIQGEKFYLKYEIKDNEGNPLKNRDYIAYNHTSGDVVIGITDNYGYTEQFVTAAPEEIEIHVVEGQDYE